MLQLSGSIRAVVVNDTCYDATVSESLHLTGDLVANRRASR